MNQIPPLNVVESPWPDGTGKLFQDAEYSGDGAFIYPTRSWSFYADGYQGAWERLFESWKTGTIKPDNLAYPLVFLCRHYIELRLKDIMETSQKLMELPVAWERTHKLEKLWRMARPLIEKVWPDEPRSTLDNVEALLLELDKMDPDSMAFRYPIDTSGKVHLPNIKGLNLAVLENAMKQIQRFLDGTSLGTSVYLDDLRSSMDY